MEGGPSSAAGLSSPGLPPRLAVEGAWRARIRPSAVGVGCAPGRSPPGPALVTRERPLRTPKALLACAKQPIRPSPGNLHPPAAAAAASPSPGQRRDRWARGFSLRPSDGASAARRACQRLQCHRPCPMLTGPPSAAWGLSRPCLRPCAPDQR
ncbi:hypothetical protein JRQ81_017038 [Phrynocephalus forsythii]|uniref:Uncharacterized protein n=1 Tax=Phrynocephalus forsythii TaxID=171643 RepID=A0A9Q1B160_9SAUR|nr:hypothetical protein JRQ81_017038 [Phrynocephalus forsythii]